MAFSWPLISFKKANSQQKTSELWHSSLYLLHMFGNYLILAIRMKTVVTSRHLKLGLTAQKLNQFSLF